MSIRLTAYGIFIRKGETWFKFSESMATAICFTQQFWAQ